MLVLALAAAALADPRDPTQLLVDRWCRLEACSSLLGGSDRSLPALAWRARGTDRFDDLLGPELNLARGASPWSDPAWRVDAGGWLSAGDLVPDYRDGDQEPGLVSPRADLAAGFYPGVVEIVAAPVLQVDLAVPAGPEADAGMVLREAWAGLRVPAGPEGQVALGGGLRGRWIGPGRFGSLLLTGNARPAPAASLAWDGRFVGQRALRGRAEVGAGWLDGDRGDVERPGWLFMDFRWQPVPLLELGLARVGIFGGVGRPRPSLGQLLVPTDPHVYDDPEKEEPDQDEIAAFDLRLLLPVGRWAGIPSSRGRRVDGLDYLEVWWQYGGEDVIRRETAGVPYPGLAGVANLVGAEAAAGPLTLTVETARILDDYFRWYTGHRVYHDGFVRDGRAMAHAAGGDAVDRQVALAWLEEQRGLDLAYGRRLRVGVVESLGDNLLALEADEVRDRLILRGWQRRGSHRWWHLGLTVERTDNTDFVPGSRTWGWRIELGG